MPLCSCMTNAGHLTGPHLIFREGFREPFVLHPTSEEISGCRRNELWAWQYAVQC